MLADKTNKQNSSSEDSASQETLLPPENERTEDGVKTIEEQKGVKSSMCVALAYQRLTFSFPQAAIELLLAAGSIDEVYAHRTDIREIVPDATDNLANIINCDWSKYLQWAEQEVVWCEQKHIRILVAGTPEYPQRLLNCIDAPVVLFYLGNADLNCEHIISVVGTRQSTSYGHDMLHSLISDLRKKIPDLLVISGLAYGIDVCSHKEAMAAGLPTVGVVAHGLDTMYPASHRVIAVQMLKNGGLLTEYPSHTRGDRQNFLRRNRIVAGISDCTIVAESMVHGGSLVTARISNDYGHEVFAFPGRIGDIASEGCNDLIRNNKAILLTCADDIIEAMGWHSQQEIEAQRSQGIQTTMFVNLTPEQQLIVDAIKDDDLQQNVISMKSGLPISRVSALLFELEMEGVVKAYAGGTYHLIR